MQYLVNDVEPLAPIHFFEEISAIPRPSFGEARIADYLVEFAKARGLRYLRDAAENVLIYKSASAGREGEDTVLLQAHTDMVAEKTPQSTHDFTKDGVRLKRVGDDLFADGTTLGADDGFGVAVMLAVLDDKTLSHPPLECLFTSAEEVGLVGASQFDFRVLRAKSMLNLDSAEEDTVIVGCCGGLRHKLTLPTVSESVSGEALRIALGGLCGGHSGEDVHRGRLNAHILMGKLLSALFEKTEFRLVTLSGGEKENAIPRECEAVILPADNKAARDFLDSMTVEIRKEIKATEDEGLFLQYEVTNVTRAMTPSATQKLLRVLSVPDGVLLWREEPQHMPELSRNLARIRTEDSAVVVALSSRSSDAAKIDASKEELEDLAAEIGGKVGHYSSYPGWESALDARLVRVWQAAFSEVTGRHAQPTLIHAGLETGLITDAVEGLEAIAVGCNIHNLHTPVERMELSSFARIYRVVLAFLEKIR